MKKLGLVLVLLLVAAGIYFFETVKPEDLSPVTPVAPASQPPVSASPPSSPPSSPLVATMPPSKGAKEAFVNYIAQEASSLDSTHVDEEAAEKEAMSQAATMGPEEIRYAKDLVIGRQGGANQRIMAVYLLTLAGPKAAGALREIALAPLPDARVEPHTEGEHRLMEEKAQRVTVIDALFEQAKGHPERKDAFLRLADEERNPGLRRYILKKAQSL